MKRGGGKCDKSNSKVRFYSGETEEKNNNEPQMQTLGNLYPLVFKSGKDMFTHVSFLLLAVSGAAEEVVTVVGIQ